MTSLERKCLVAIALLCSFVAFAPAQNPRPPQAGPASQLVLSGKIKVNGKAVSPGFAIGSGDTVETAKGSSAVVSLGKLGRVEALPSSKMNITYEDTSMTVVLDSGAARVTKSEGMSAKVSTKDGEVVASSPLAGSFTVNTECGNTLVTSHTVAVEARGHDSGTIMVTPGSHASIGSPRPGCKPKPAKLSIHN